MKSKISLIVSALAALLMFNACQTPEERAKESSTTDSATQSLDSAATSMSTDTASNKTVTDTASANVTKSKKGKATVVMVGAHDAKAKMEADKEGVYARAEVMPSYPGGQAELQKFVEDN